LGENYYILSKGYVGPIHKNVLCNVVLGMAIQSSGDHKAPLGECAKTENLTKYGRPCARFWNEEEKVGDCLSETLDFFPARAVP